MNKGGMEMNIDPKALRRAWLNFGISREQAAEALGVEPKTLAAWEQGDKAPRGRHLVWLAGLYGRHIDDFAAKEEG